MPVPIEVRTARLFLRPWRTEDAEEMRPILEANRGHIGPWIPARVALPAPVDVLASRLSGFAADFAADREWRYGMFKLADDTMLGEVSLFPRTSARRVPLADADRAELGYWLREDETGRGYTTEAARALLDVAGAFPQFSRVEIRCDARNTASAGVPRRLGFALTDTIEEPNGASPPIQLQVWTLQREVSPSRGQVGYIEHGESHEPEIRAIDIDGGRVGRACRFFEAWARSSPAIWCSR